MEKTYEMTDEAVLAELGDRLSRLRLQRNLTQAQLAREAGVSKRTLIRVVRALGLLGNLDAFVPPPLSSPIAQLRSQRQERRRASPGVTKSGPPPQWTWGDDLSKTGGEP